MKKKKIIFAVIAILLLGGGWYGYSEYTRKVKDLTKVKAGVHINAPDLIAAFEKNEGEANRLYLDKIIAVKGRVKEVEKSDMGSYSIVLGDEESMSSVRCSIDLSYLREVEGIKTGTVVVMKGSCTGFNEDEMLGSDVILNRSVLSK
jgi:hypothetical protein